MRTQYPLLSTEINDSFLEAYSRNTYLLGRDDDEGYTTYSGVYDIHETELKDMHQYIVLGNSNAPSNSIVNKSITNYLDKIAYKQRLRRL